MFEGPSNVGYSLCEHLRARGAAPMVGDVDLLAEAGGQAGPNLIEVPAGPPFAQG